MGLTLKSANLKKDDVKKMTKNWKKYILADQGNRDDFTQLSKFIKREVGKGQSSDTVLDLYPSNGGCQIL